MNWPLDGHMVPSFYLYLSLAVVFVVVGAKLWIHLTFKRRLISKKNWLLIIGLDGKKEKYGSILIK